MYSQNRFINTYNYSYREMGINMGAMDMAQDRYGNLWFKDYYQIGKFDGKKFYNLGNPILNANLEKLKIYDLGADTSRNIWISAEDGLYKFDEYNNFKKYTPKHPRNGKFFKDITTLLRGKKGGFYCGTASGEIFFFEENKDSVVMILESHDIGMIRALLMGLNSTLWITTSKGIFAFENGQLSSLYVFKNPTKHNDYFDNHYFRLKYGKDGYILANDDNMGLLFFDEDNRALKKRLIFADIPDNQVSDMYWLKNGYWIIATNNGLYWLNTVNFSFYKEDASQKIEHVISDQNINTIYRTNNDILWFGTSSGLAKWQYNNELFVNFDLNNKSKIVLLKTIPGFEGKWFVVTQKDGIFTFKVDGQLVANISNDLPSIITFATTSFDNQELWIQENKTLKAYKFIDDTKLSNALVEFALPGTQINDLKFFDSNTAMLIIDKKLYKLNIDLHLLSLINDNLDEDFNAIAISKAGKTFIGGKKLYLFENDSLILIKHKIIDQINALTFDDLDNLWIGADKLYKYNVTKSTFIEYDERNGLTMESVQNVLYDMEDNIWIGSKQGLQQFNITSEQSHLFTYQDGLAQNNCLSGLSLVLPGLVAVHDYGFFSFYRPRAKFNLLQDVEFQIKSILLNGEDNTASSLKNSSITIPYDKSSLKIDYAFPCFLENSLYKIQYRLLSSSGDTLWRDAPLDNTLVFNQLKPSHYQLELKASSTYFLSEAKYASIAIEALAPFYKTWWFNLIILLGTAIIIGAIFYFRELQRRRMEILRMNIARDLHDEMGSNLSNIKLLSELEAMQNSDKSATFQKIAEKSSKIMDSMSDIIWNINPSNDDLKNVVTRIQQNAIEVLEPLGIHLKFDIDVTHDQLNIGIENRKDYYFLCKEVVNNISKYANAKNVSIIIHVKNKRIFTSISDDGSGFDINDAPNGNGLNNMTQRAENMKGEFHIDSKIDKGTTISLAFNAK